MVIVRRKSFYTGSKYWCISTLLCWVISSECSTSLQCFLVFCNTNISYPLIRTRTCAYQGVSKVSAAENYKALNWKETLSWNDSTKQSGNIKTLGSMVMKWDIGFKWTNAMFTLLKGCVCYILAGLFGKSKREHLWNSEKCFLFHFKSSFRSRNNEILTF